MDAVVTLKASPAQFDLLREAITTAIASWNDVYDRSSDGAVRREARAKIVELESLRDSLR